MIPAQYVFLLPILIPPLLLPQLAFADSTDGGTATIEAEAEPDAGAAEPDAELDVPPVVPLLQGESAPWNGLLVPEATFVGYLKLDLDLQEAQGLASIRASLLEEQQTIYEGAMRQVATISEESWWDRYALTIGIIIGLVGGIGLVFGGVALLECM